MQAYRILVRKRMQHTYDARQEEVFELNHNFVFAFDHSCFVPLILLIQ
jgi:hypothetical protein